MRKRGFTTVEAMIVVAVIGLLAAIAIPSFIKARKESQKHYCIKNLREIAKVKYQWAVAHNKKDGDPVIVEELIWHIPEKEEMTWHILGGRLPECPAGGKYSFGKVGENPTCNIKDHVLVVPPKTMKKKVTDVEVTEAIKENLEILRERLEYLDVAVKEVENVHTIVQELEKSVQELDKIIQALVKKREALAKEKSAETKPSAEK